jgi:Glycosyl hydrolase family 30 beta sandwich domain
VPIDALTPMNEPSCSCKWPGADLSSADYGVTRGVDDVAFVNPDGSKVLVAYNNRGPGGPAGGPMAASLPELGPARPRHAHVHLALSGG